VTGRGVRYFVVWPKESDKPRQHEELSGVELKGDTIRADQLPEPLKLTRRSQIADSGSMRKLMGESIASDRIRIVRDDGKVSFVWETDQKFMTSEILDRDSALSEHEQTLMKGLSWLLSDRERILDGLGFEEFPDKGNLARLRNAMSGDSPQKIREGITSLNLEDSALLFTCLTTFGESLTSKAPASNAFMESMIDVLRDNIRPWHDLRRNRRRFVMSPRHLEERMGVVLNGGKRESIDAAEDVMEHYALAGLFVEPSKDAHLGEITGLLEHREPKVRAYMASALGFLKANRAVPDLIRRLDDGNAEVVKASILALGNMKEWPETYYDRATDSLEKFLKHRDPEVRECTVLAFGEIGGQKSYDLLSRRLKAEKDPVIRDDIGWKLERLRQQGIGDKDG
jgi:hypothetical protein